jgi:ATP-dependent exoDNAse (exonuclease V) alpha subunit
MKSNSRTIPLTNAIGASLNFSILEESSQSTMKAVAAKFTVQKDDGKTVSFDAGRIGQFDHGYALTVHGSKGPSLEPWRI